MKKTNKLPISLILVLLFMCTMHHSNANQQFSIYEGGDKYILYDKEGRFPLAEVMFNVNVIQDNQTFSINQTITYNTLEHKYDDNWELNELYYEIKEVYTSCWGYTNETMRCNVRSGDVSFYEGSLLPGKSESIIQNITAPSYWTGDRYSFSPEFMNMKINTSSRGKVDIPFSVYFIFTENGCESEPVEKSVNLPSFSVSPWEIYGNNFKTLVNGINILLILVYLCILLYLIVLVKSLSKLKTVLSLRIRESSWKEKLFAIKTISKFFKAIGWIILLAITHFLIYNSINSMKLVSASKTHNYLFLISIFLLLVFPNLLLLIQKFILRNKENDLLIDGNDGIYLEFKAVQKELLINVEFLYGLLLLLLRPLIVYVMDHGLTYV